MNSTALRSWAMEEQPLNSTHHHYFNSHQSSNATAAMDTDEDLISDLIDLASDANIDFKPEELLAIKREIMLTGECSGSGSTTGSCSGSGQESGIGSPSHDSTATAAGDPSSLDDFFTTATSHGTGRDEILDPWLMMVNGVNDSFADGTGSQIMVHPSSIISMVPNNIPQPVNLPLIIKKEELSHEEEEEEDIDDENEETDDDLERENLDQDEDLSDIDEEEESKHQIQMRFMKNDHDYHSARQSPTNCSASSQSSLSSAEEYSQSISPLPQNSLTLPRTAVGPAGKKGPGAKSVKLNQSAAAAAAAAAAVGLNGRVRPTRSRQITDLILSDEEKRLLSKEGYQNFPMSGSLPLTKQEEKILRKIRRKIRNKRSAQCSRQRKKEYLEDLEKKYNDCTSENDKLKREVIRLRKENESLMGKMKRMVSGGLTAVSGGGGGGTGSTAAGPGQQSSPAVSLKTSLFVLVMSFMLILVPYMSPFESAESNLLLSSAPRPNPGTGRHLLMVYLNEIHSAASAHPATAGVAVLLGGVTGSGGGGGLADSALLHHGIGEDYYLGYYPAAADNYINHHNISEVQQIQISSDYLVI